MLVREEQFTGKGHTHNAFDIRMLLAGGFNVPALQEMPVKINCDMGG
jgi:hypothetical protein